jgi:adenylosuccinate lyase
MIPRYSNPEMAAVWSEQNKMATWLQVELAVCEAWADLGVVPAEALREIREKAQLDHDSMDALMREIHHDVVAFVRTVADSVGEAGRWIHFGLTSSDVIDTALAVQTLQAVDLLDRGLQRLETATAELAVRHKYTPMIGRSHGVHAEPTTFGHRLCVWVDQTRRNRQRLAAARREMAVGKLSGSVGTHANVPAELEELVCARLGLEPDPASTQIVQRDRHAYFISTLAVIAATLEQQALQVRLFQQTELGEAAEPFGSRQQGSSSMPHKRNPELAERVCGLARLIRGYAVPALDDVALWHERDISHSSVERVIFPDACLALDYILGVMAQIVEGLDVFDERMAANLDLTRGLVYSQRVLLALTEAGLDRQAAYDAVQSNAKRVWRGEGDFKSLLADDPRVTGVLSADDLDALFDLGYHLARIEVPFARLGLG